LVPQAQTHSFQMIHNTSDGAGTAISTVTRLFARWSGT